MQLCHEVVPLELELPGGFGNDAGQPNSPYFCGIEAIRAARCLLLNCGKVRVDCGYGMLKSSKSLQLWVMPVAFRAIQKYCSRKEGLTPQGSKPRRIEILRV